MISRQISHLGCSSLTPSLTSSSSTFSHLLPPSPTFSHLLSTSPTFSHHLPPPLSRAPPSMQDGKVLTWLCELVPAARLAKAPPMSPVVVLSIVQQLGAELTSDTKLRLGWLKETLHQINVHDPQVTTAAPLHPCTPAPLHPCTPAPRQVTTASLPLLSGAPPFLVRRLPSLRALVPPLPDRRPGRAGAGAAARAPRRGLECSGARGDGGRPLARHLPDPEAPPPVTWHPISARRTES